MAENETPKAIEPAPPAEPVPPLTAEMLAARLDQVSTRLRAVAVSRVDHFFAKLDEFLGALEGTTPPKPPVKDADAPAKKKG